MLDGADSAIQEATVEDKIAAIYARDSSPGQIEGSSLETQVVACGADATKDGLSVPEEFTFEELGSGMDNSRPLFLKFNSLIENIHQGVFIYSPERYSRNPFDLKHLYEVCERTGVELHFVT